MTFSREVMSLRVASVPYFLSPWLQPFQNDIQTYEVDAKLAAVNMEP
jgi:hypothetical protein